VECQLLDGRGKLRVDSRLVAPRIHSKPAEFRQVNSVETVQRIGGARVIDAEPVPDASTSDAEHMTGFR